MTTENVATVSFPFSYVCVWITADFSFVTQSLLATTLLVLWQPQRKDDKISVLCLKKKLEFPEGKCFPGGPTASVKSPDLKSCKVYCSLHYRQNCLVFRCGCRGQIWPCSNPVPTPPFVKTAEFFCSFLLTPIYLVMPLRLVVVRSFGRFLLQYCHFLVTSSKLLHFFRLSVLIHTRDNRTYILELWRFKWGLKPLAHCLKFGQLPLSLTVPG